MELPEDVVNWVGKHFGEAEREEALSHVRAVVAPADQRAQPRLLRCVAVASQGDLNRLKSLIADLAVDWRDVLMAGEYAIRNGKPVQIRDLTKPIPDK